MVRFNNDPAREGRGQSAQEAHPEVCFQIMLDDLLILGLEVGSPNDVPASLVDVVPDALAQDPKFRSQIIQQNFFFRETSSGVTAICKKKAADNGFTLAFTNPAARGATPAPLTNLLEQLTPPPVRAGVRQATVADATPPHSAPRRRKRRRPRPPPALPAGQSLRRLSRRSARRLPAQKSRHAGNAAGIGSGLVRRPGARQPGPNR